MTSLNTKDYKKNHFILGLQSKLTMAATTALAYCIMLVLTPIPNVGLLSYINKKPLLNKVNIHCKNTLQFSLHSS